MMYFFHYFIKRILAGARVDAYIAKSGKVT